MIKRGKAEKSATRSERLAAALRENLKRRKAQARDRDLRRKDALAENAASDGEIEPPAPDFRRNRDRD